jgi:Flp pilus assembly protein TadG
MKRTVHWVSLNRRGCSIVWQPVGQILRSFAALNRDTRGLPVLRPGRARFRGKAGGAGTAALEFAVASPLLVIFIGGVADLGLAQFSRAVLANAVSAGAEYANLTGSSVSAVTVQAVVMGVGSPPLNAGQMSVAITGPTYTCLSGNSFVAPTSGTTCADGSTEAYYLKISATYTLSGLMGGFMSAATWTTAESMTLSLQ